MMIAVLKYLLGWATGDLAGALTKAYQAKIDAKSESERIAADVEIERIKDAQDARRNAKEIRLATAGFWEMRLITAVIAGCFTLHLLLVTLDTCWALGWRIAKFPAPFDQWEGQILLSFFGVQVAGQAIGGIAAAIRGRR